MQKLTAIVLAVVIAAAMLIPVGCAKSPDDLIIGSWKCVGTNSATGSVMTQVYKFEKNGDCHIYYTLDSGVSGVNSMTVDCTYLIYDNYIYLSKEGETEDIVYKLKVTEDKLVLTTTGFADIQSIELERIA